MRMYVLAGLFLLPFLAIAQAVDIDCEGSGLICNPLMHHSIDSGQINTIQDFLTFLLDILVKISIPIIAVSIIWTGFVYATSKGDPTKLKKAHAMAWYIVLGAGLVFLAKGMQLAIQSTIDTLK